MSPFLPAARHVRITLTLEFVPHGVVPPQARHVRMKLTLEFVPPGVGPPQSSQPMMVELEANTKFEHGSTCEFIFFLPTTPRNVQTGL
jgi:hypothetical protein